MFSVPAALIFAAVALGGLVLFVDQCGRAANAHRLGRLADPGRGGPAGPRAGGVGPTRPGTPS